VTSKPTVLRRILVANRGEIAVRILRTCRALGIETVLAVSDADRDALPARLAGSAVRIGPAQPAASYLNVAAVVGAALAVRADAVHPGYGFLSESPRLARACAAAGVVFIGPAAEHLEAVGDKLAARGRAAAAGLPVLPGGAVVPRAGAARNGAAPAGRTDPTGRTGAAELTGRTGAAELSDRTGAAELTDRTGAAELTDRTEAAELTDRTEAAELTDRTEAAELTDRAARTELTDRAARTELTELAGRIGWPILVKAVGGGGGRGLRPAADPAELAAAVERAAAEAEAAFGDPRVYLEHYVPKGRHVEVQLLGDGERVIHIGDRDCSVQRRYQKLLEEAPAPLLDDGLRDQIRQAGVTFGKFLGYRGLGTVEFLADAERGDFWFLEMNARIQVEHPVTEAISGLDLVAEQIAVAEGRPLRLGQDDVTLTGHAIECRINAEDPAAGFRPSPGRVTRAVFPAGPGVRVDTHVQAGSAVPPGYDSLLAKLTVSGRDRTDALARLRGALARCQIDGVATTIGMHAGLAADGEFARGGVDTGYLARFLGRPDG
jgi:acetyl-CoA carboxylase, biotin carboxylase subunit